MARAARGGGGEEGGEGGGRCLCSLSCCGSERPPPEPSSLEKGCVCARVSACPARGDEAAARRMMCAATASPAAASSGPGGDGFFPAATISSSPAPGALFMPLPEGSLAAAGLGLGLPAPDSRGHYQLLLSGRALADRYRRIYTAALSDRDQGGSSAGHPASRCVSGCPSLRHMLHVRSCVCVSVSVCVCLHTCLSSCLSASTGC